MKDRKNHRFLNNLCFITVCCYSMYTYVEAGITGKCPRCCFCDQDKTDIRLLCDCLPDVIPDNTTYFVLDESSAFPTWPNLTHSSWWNVRSLTLHVSRKRGSSSLTRHTFLGAASLEEFHMSGYHKLNRIPAGTFEHLQELKVLDLSNNRRLTFSGLSAIFADLQDKALDVLNVSNTNRNRGMAVTILDTNSFKMMQRLPVKVLDMSSAGRIYIDSSQLPDNETIRFRFPYLEVLNISHTMILMPKVKVKVQKVKKKRYDLMFPVLRKVVYQGFGVIPKLVMDVGYCMTKRKNPRTTCTSYSSKNIYFPPLLESINLDDSAAESGLCSEGSTGGRPTACINANNNLRSISLRNTGLTVWNYVLLTLNNLKTLDLSNNKIKSISDRSLLYFPNLERLLLGSNRLGTYQYNASFGSFLTYALQLREIDLSRNNLSHIPRFMFLNNVWLEVIDMSGNHIASLSFEIPYLWNLKVLNVSKNIISSIEDFSLQDIEGLSSRRSLPFIDMNHNSFNCSCDSKAFIKTVEGISKSLINYESYECSYEGDNTKLQSISQATLERDCILEILAIVSPVLCSVVAVVILVIVSYTRRHSLNMLLKSCCLFGTHGKKLTDYKKGVFTTRDHQGKGFLFTRIYNDMNSDTQLPMLERKTATAREK